MGQTRNIYEMNMIINWLKCHMRKLIFFVVFFMGFGTSSIWMSALFLDIDCKDIVVGILTISIAAVYTSAERIVLYLFEEKTSCRSIFVIVYSRSINIGQFLIKTTLTQPYLPYFGKQMFKVIYT